LFYIRLKFYSVHKFLNLHTLNVRNLTGQESTAELQNLASDIFDYFGLGCRSVSKLFFPKDYDIAQFYEAIEPFKDIGNHYKYSNNYDYNKSIYLINGDEHFDNGFLLLKKDERTASPLATIYFERYENIAQVEEYLRTNADLLQCIITGKPLAIPQKTFTFGESQRPGLSDYADNVNTLEFLRKQ